MQVFSKLELSYLISFIVLKNIGKFKFSLRFFKNKIVFNRITNNYVEKL